MPRAPALLLIAALAAPATAQMDLGVNRDDHGPFLVSTDLLWGRPAFDWSTAQSALSAAHVKGSGVFELANPRVAIRDRNAGTVAQATLRLAGDSGDVTVSGWIVAGTSTFRATGFADGPDQDWPAGTLADAPGWDNPAHLPLAPGLVAGGVDTGYPAGLASGQWAGWTAVQDGGIVLPAGDWTPRASGTGKVRLLFGYRDGSYDTWRVVAFRSGKPDTRTIPLPRPDAGLLIVHLLESDPADPLHGLQLLRPGAAEAGWNPEYLADLAPGRVVRNLDIQHTNHSTVRTWTAAEEATVRRIVGVANAAKVDPWLNVPHQADDAYVASLRDLLDATLDPALGWYAEHSNEVWNGDFQQALHARRHGSGLVPTPESAWKPATSARWVQTPGPDQSYLEITVPTPHGLAGGQRIVRLDGFADARLDGVYRGDDLLQDRTGDPRKILIPYAWQGESLPLPAKAGDVPVGPSGLRWAELVVPDAAPRWHARRTREICEIASKGKRFRAGVLGLWAASGSNDAQMDLLVAEYGGKLPNYPILAAIAPYPYLDDPAAIRDRDLAGDRRSIGSLTARGGVATASGPYARPDGSASAEHGLKAGDRINVVNAHPAAYCGPTTVASATATEFTYALPPGPPDLPPAGPFLDRSAPGFVPLPAYGREVVAIAAGPGETLVLASPRHGLAAGDVVHLSGCRPPWCDGRYAIASATQDAVTIRVPGLVAPPASPAVPAQDARPWLVADEAIARILDGLARHVDGPFDSKGVKPLAESAIDRGLVPAIYEFGYGCAPSPPYRGIEPANLAFQAASRDARLAPILLRALRTAYARGVRVLCWYGHAGGKSFYGSWPAKEWLEDSDAPGWQALAAARTLYGTPASGPSLRIDPPSTTAGRPTRVKVALDGAGAGLDLAKLLPTVKGGEGAALSGWDGASALLDPGQAPGDLLLTLGGASRTFAVLPAIPLDFRATPATVPAGKPRTFTLSGPNARWSADTRFAVSGGTATISAARVFGRRLAEIDLDPGGTPDPLTISDGEGGTATITVRPAPRPGLVDGADDPDFVTTGNWLAWGSGVGGGKMYHQAGDKTPSTAAWTMRVPASGRWRVSANWTGDAVHAPDCRYSLSIAGKSSGSLGVDQRQPSSGGPEIGGWPSRVLFEFDARKGDPAVLSLDGLGAGIVNADAALFELVAPSVDPDVKPDPPRPSEIDVLREQVARAEAANKSLSESVAAIRAEAEAKGKAVDKRLKATEAKQRESDATLERLRSALVPKPE